MAKTINDPVFGELTYDDVKQGWTREISLGIWGADDYKIDLVVSCRENGLCGVSVNEEITDKQREAYKSYLANLSNIEDEVPDALYSYYVDHYEEFLRTVNLRDKLKIDVVDVDATLCVFYPAQLFIDRKGNYGWLGDFVSDRYLISVILSDGKPRIFEGWDALKKGVIDDDVFGVMTFDNGWRKTFKSDINGYEAEYPMRVEAAFSTSKITPEQKAHYKKYIENEQKFKEEYPKTLLKFFKMNYEYLSEYWKDAKSYRLDSIDEEIIKSLVTFDKLYFGRRKTYGWECECAWGDAIGDEYRLAIYYDDSKEGICIGTLEDLIFG